MVLIKVVLLIAAVSVLVSPASAETLAELKARMDKFAESFNGTLGYSLHFKGEPEATITRLPDEPFPTASTIKTAIMCEVMHQIEQGKIKWKDKLEVQPSDDRQGGGFAFYFKEGTKLTIGEWVHLMITVSDNTNCAISDATYTGTPPWNEPGQRTRPPDGHRTSVRRRTTCARPAHTRLPSTRAWQRWHCCARRTRPASRSSPCRW